MISHVYTSASGRKVYISNLQGARHIEKLKALEITHVLTVLPKALGFWQGYKPAGITQVIIEAEDNHRSALSKHFDSAADYISNILTKSNILIHCSKGISRSPTITACYLIKYTDMFPTAAISLLKSKRSQIRPNLSFVNSLNTFHATITK